MQWIMDRIDGILITATLGCLAVVLAALAIAEAL